MAHEDYKEMLPARALSALDPGDERALSQHLSECAECRSELANWEATAASLALSVPPVEPSPEVRDRIMSAVHSEPRREEPQQSRLVEFPQGRRAGWSAFGRVGAIAAAVLFLVLILWIIVLWQQNRALHRDNDALASGNDVMGREVDRLSQFVEILSKPGAKFKELQGTGEGAGANAQLVYEPSGRVMLIAQGLPPAPAGKEYQLWFIVGSNPLPGRTFAPYEYGRGEVIDQIPSAARDKAVFAVTLEPEGGNLSPTGAIYLRSGL